jgi:hypothetical protein
MAWLQNWHDWTIQEDILINKGFVQSSDTLTINEMNSGEYNSFRTYYRTYSAGTIETFDTLGAFTDGAAAFIYLAFIYRTTKVTGCQTRKIFNLKKDQIIYANAGMMSYMDKSRE